MSSEASRKFLPSITLFLLIATFTAAQVDFEPARGFSDRQAVQIISADVNGDGRSDILSLQQIFNSGAVAFYLNQGDGTYAAPYTSPTIYFPLRMAVGDFNQDGHLDVAATTYGNQQRVRDSRPHHVSLMLGDGAGSFHHESITAVPESSSSLALGDFNNDNRPDLAVVGRDSRTVTILNNTGSGFQLNSFPVPTYFHPNRRSAAPDLLSDLIAGDFNADGNMDLAYAANCRTCLQTMARIFMLQNDGSERFIALGIDTELYYFKNLMAADLDGDGNSDILHHSYYSGVVYGDPYWNFPRREFPRWWGMGVSGLHVADVNSDGLLDLVMPGESGSGALKGIQIYINTASRQGFTGPFVIEDYSIHEWGANSLASGYVDGSNKDIVWLRDGSITVYPNSTPVADAQCQYPDRPYLIFCSPRTSSTTALDVRIKGMYHASKDPANRIEVWIDGRKRFQVFSDAIDRVIPFTAGAHQITLVGVDATGRYVKSSQTLMAGAVSAAPVVPEKSQTTVMRTTEPKASGRAARPRSETARRMTGR